MNQAIAIGVRRRPLRFARGVGRFAAENPGAAVGGGLVFAFIVMGAVSPFVHGAAYNQDLLGRLTPPAWQGGGSTRHLLGTDTLGRDVLARIVTAVGISLLIATVSVLAAGAIGVLLGVLAGYRGGWLDHVVMRVADSFLAVPLVLLAVSVIAVAGPSVRNLILLIAGTQWMLFARTARAETLSLRERPFVVAVRSLGARTSTILFKHIVPHVLPSVIALATLNLSIVVLLEAALSYLGLGIQAPDPSLGSMLFEGRQYIERASWLGIWPGLALLLLVLGVNLLGEGLRSHLDPASALRERRGPAFRPL